MSDLDALIDSRDSLLEWIADNAPALHELDRMSQLMLKGERLLRHSPGRVPLAHPPDRRSRLTNFQTAGHHSASIGIRRASRLTEGQKEEARRRYAAGDLMKAIAADLGVSVTNIGRVVRGIKPPPRVVACGDCEADRCKVHKPRGVGKRCTKVYPHGTNARYFMNGCRCGSCRAAAMSQARERERAKLYGRSDDRAPAWRARDHLRMLAEAGIGPKQVSKACGVAASSLSRIMGSRAQGSRGKRTGSSKWRPAGYRPMKKIRRSIEDRILAVTLSDARPPGGLMSKEETDVARRRVEELVAAGVRQWQIAVWLDPKLKRVVAKGRRPGLQLKRRPGLITRKTHDSIERLYVTFFRARGQATPEEQRSAA